MSEPFIGQITAVGFNFAPRGWAFCNGQLLPIAQNEALFTLIGTTYGGDGVSTFALPNLQSRIPIHQGQGPGLQNYVLGQAAGTEAVTLTVAQMPAHTHPVSAVGANADQTVPTGRLWATEAAGATSFYSDQAPDGPMAAAAISAAGGSQPHDNLMPYLTVNYVIALEGVFPSQS